MEFPQFALNDVLSKLRESGTSPPDRDRAIPGTVDLEGAESQGPPGGNPRRRSLTARRDGYSFGGPFT